MHKDEEVLISLLCTPDKSRRNKGKLKGAKGREEGDYPVSDKEYKPQAFTDTHISDLVRENDVLRDKVMHTQVSTDNSFSSRRMMFSGTR